MRPQHDCLFSRPNGQPYNDAELSRTFSLAAYRLAGAPARGRRLPPAACRLPPAACRLPPAACRQGLAACQGPAACQAGPGPLAALRPRQGARCRPRRPRPAPPCPAHPARPPAPAPPRAGKRTTPHMVRDSIVTHLRSGDASERQLEALALYMGHSIKMQRDSYDRRTKAQKVEPAVELLRQLNSGAQGGGGV
jgi:hypothetical protein